ncbi:hypothetical protein [Bacillus thuringiensis]|uniref:hypothetical protein n=1 Tax=Bacillus thuringiensis TaxID=1428 RepID=UPI00111248F8|nr:hypothetical protein [Bacillus thuringiensis]QCY65035.1 hypothetical protein FHE73_30745 [Bacillus thuringiensis]
MTNTTTLNELAVAAKVDEGAMWEVKAYFMSFIEGLAKENWYKMNNEASFIDDAYRRIEYAVRTYNPKLGEFKNRAYTIIRQGVKEHCGKRGGKRKSLSSMEELVDRQARTVGGNKYNPTELNRFDVEAKIDIEEEVLNKIEGEELTNKYAENETDTMIIEIILGMTGKFSQSEATRMLAEKTGRTFNSARGAVRSFMKRKKAQVAAA